MKYNQSFIENYLKKLSEDHYRKFEKDINKFNEAKKDLKMYESKKQDLIELLENYDIDLNLKRNLLKQEKSNLTNTVTVGDLSDVNVINDMNEMKNNINDLEKYISNLEDNISVYKKLLVSVKNSIESTQVIIQEKSKYRNQYQETLDILLTDSNCQEKIAEYSEALHALSLILDSYNLDFYLKFNKSTPYMTDIFIENQEGETLTFRGEQQVLYNYLDRFREREYIHLNSIHSIHSSALVYSVLDTISKNDMHFDTFTDDDGNTHLHAIYFYNPNHNTEDDSFIRVGTSPKQFNESCSELKEIEVSFSTKPTSF